MKAYSKRRLKSLLLIVFLFATTIFILSACKSDDQTALGDTETESAESKETDDTTEIVTGIANESRDHLKNEGIGDQTENKGTAGQTESEKTLAQAESSTTSATEVKYDTAKTMLQNIDILNDIIKEKYGRKFSLSTIEEYEMAGQSDWMMMLGADNDKVAIDIGTWKYDYSTDSEESKYMEAVLTAFIFFYGEEMGNDLWLLTGDLNDGGADESLYGFSHTGSKAIYKNGNTASFQAGSFNNFYIWLTPDGHLTILGNNVLSDLLQSNYNA